MNGSDNTRNSYTYLSDDTYALTSDEAIQRVGGCGWFQFGLVMVIMFNCTLPGHIMYIIAFLQDRDITTINCVDFDGNSMICD